MPTFDRLDQRPERLLHEVQDAFSRGYLGSELLDRWTLEATPDAAAMITRARAELHEGNVTVR